ncbi:hypothetical protein [Dechloromonas sp.]|uniref:hypothetical protein n=1 Tax=Dechloromonas sp. TaxID=1917218 RepID=UPI00121CA677|nr:hypothetical protein [Dechloromonas sp.]MBU3696923.1 hypothetical protein [Dechloromonas sp.]TEX49304.1 MAG: hypothetical protein CFR70_03710 [Rhodocyclaceae bacterium]
MTELITGIGFPAMSEASIAKVSAFAEIASQAEQANVTTRHLLHAGMYARTMRLSAGHVLVGALVKVATIVIFNGDAEVYVGDGSMRLTGYHVIPADALRKQVFLAYSDCDITAIFPTDAGTVEQAENEATGEAESLLSRWEGNPNILQSRSPQCLTQQP